MCGYAVGMVYEDQAKSALKRSLLTADDAVWTNLLTVKKGGEFLNINPCLCHLVRIPVPLLRRCVTCKCLKN